MLINSNKDYFNSIEVGRPTHGLGSRMYLLCTLMASKRRSDEVKRQHARPLTRKFFKKSFQKTGTISINLEHFLNWRIIEECPMKKFIFKRNFPSWLVGWFQLKGSQALNSFGAAGARARQANPSSGAGSINNTFYKLVNRI